VSANNNTKKNNAVSRGRKKQAQPEAEAPLQTAVQPPIPAGTSRDFERELQDHFAAEARKKLEEETEHIFGSVLARHGWIRNEHGQVEYVGAEGF
jgi:hypothetical protein